MLETKPKRVECHRTKPSVHTRKRWKGSLCHLPSSSPPTSIPTTHHWVGQSPSLCIILYITQGCEFLSCKQDIFICVELLPIEQNISPAHGSQTDALFLLRWPQERSQIFLGISPSQTHDLPTQKFQYVVITVTCYCHIGQHPKKREKM